MSDVGASLAQAVEEAAGASSKEEAIAKALECPCVEGLKTSSCGESFVEALTCFMRAEESERGEACVEPFVALHACMVKHPDEFEAFTAELVENERKEGYDAPGDSKSNEAGS
jgi:intermembrane space import and assembly protein 40|tara:strand:- start:35 stop:373 length:339 start_codon:yes stop_codon:yes gene_type:complete